MELRHLRYFLAVAEELHFTRAAALLRVAQPALSHQIRQLEREVGVTLLDRTKHRVKLTPAGEVFRNRARVVIEQAARAAEDAAKVGRGDAGSVFIGVGSTGIWSVLPDLLRRLRQVSGAITIAIREMEPSDQMEALRHQTIDFAIMAARPVDPELESIVLSREKLILALPTGHAAASRHSVELKSLAHETIILPGRLAMPGFHEIVVAACEEAGFVPADTVTTRLIQTVVCLVAGRLGVALVPESFGRNLQVRGVEYRPLRGTAPVTELNAVWRKDNDLPLVRRFQTELRLLAAKRRERGPAPSARGLAPAVTSDTHRR
jgi:DNA-binding transcriptional LysR family regulator